MTVVARLVIHAVYEVVSDGIGSATRPYMTVVVKELKDEASLTVVEEDMVLRAVPEMGNEGICGTSACNVTMTAAKER